MRAGWWWQRLSGHQDRAQHLWVLATRSYAQGAEQVIRGRFGAGSGGPGAGASGAGAADYPGLPASLGGAGGPQQISPTRRAIGKFFRFFLPISGAATLWYGFTHPDDTPLVPSKLPPELQYLASQKHPNDQTLINWRLFQPETESEVEAFLRQASKAGQKLRVMGSGLSPNGLALSEEGVLSMALMDKVVKVDKEKKQVTVQAGIRVQALADALAPHGLTLQNFASIKDQQVGGLTQAAAHGTGARIPTADDTVVSMRLVTPGVGPITLDSNTEPELFSLAKAGLGALGVVTQVTLQCVPRVKLVERTFTASVSEVKKNHAKWLQTHRHLRYLWLPYTDTVVVITVDPENSQQGQAALAAASESTTSAGSKSAAAGGTSVETSTVSSSSSDSGGMAYRLQPLRDLLLSAPESPHSPEEVGGMSATQLRDALLALDPLNKDWVSKVNSAEALYWSRSSGVRSGWSDEILGFDCGGQQWVMEVAFPIGKLSSLQGVTKDLTFMEDLMKEIRSNKIPAPSPIEQRWTAGSSSPMSPSHGAPDEVFSWVGIIMYLPEDQAARDRITQAFRSYSRVVRERLMPRYNAASHWAKLEVPEGAGDLQALRARLAARYPLKKFNEYREVLDPANILANEWVDTLLGPAGAK